MPRAPAEGGDMTDLLPLAPFGALPVDPPIRGHLYTAPEILTGHATARLASFKAMGVPVYQLLGGRCRDKVRVYRGIGGATPQELADDARRAVTEQGFTAVKMMPQPPVASTTASPGKLRICIVLRSCATQPTQVPLSSRTAWRKSQNSNLRTIFSPGIATPCASSTSFVSKRRTCSSSA